MAGNVSRSIDAAAGRDTVATDGLQHVGAGVDQVGRRLVGGGFSTKASTRPSVVGGHHAEADGSSTGVRAIVASAAPLAVEGHQGAEVEVGEDVAVDHEERLVDAGVAGGEGHGSGSVEGLGSTA